MVAETNILRELSKGDYPIVKYKDWIVDPEHRKVYIIMELCSEGDLGKLLKDLKDSGRNLNEQTIWNIFFQMCQAIKICHSRE